MRKIDSSTPSEYSHACQELCECDLCLRVYRAKTEESQQVQNFSDIMLPNNTAYKFLCDQIVNSPINEKLNFQIIDTFFCQGKKIVTYYHNNESGQMVNSTIKGGFKEVERILRNKKYIPSYPPLTRIERKLETAKDAVNRKIKNNVGIMVSNDGTYTYLNQLNISHEINTMSNISFIKSFHAYKLTPVYYKYKDVCNKQYYKRARTYLKVLAKQITPYEINYIKKQEEYCYQQDLYRHDLQQYLVYLTCKLCHLILMDECLLIRSGVIVWAVDTDTTAVYLANAHQVRYSIQKDPNQVLQKFVNNKRQRVQRKLKDLSSITVVQPSARMKKFQYLLKQSFQAVVNQLAPKIQVDTKLETQANQAFKKFHPNAKYNLSDIIRNNQKFNTQMKKLFVKKHYRNRTTPKSITTQVTSNKQQQYFSNKSIISPTTARNIRTLRILSRQKHYDDDKTERKIEVKSSSRFPRYNTQFSNRKLCF